MSPLGDQMDGKVVLNEFRNPYSNRKSDGMPMKMLIAQEMSKDLVARRSPPNVIAKLMGLDTLPRQEIDPSRQRNNSRSHSRSHSDIPRSYWEQQNGFSQYVEHNEYKDLHKIFQKSPLDVRCHESINERRMLLVRQKFSEAKRLSMDEKLRESKEFQDALEVLNSNKDLLLQCLQEPDSMLSQNLYNLRSIPPPPETKRITVLRPSKMANNSNFFTVGNTDRKQINKGTFCLMNGFEENQLINSSPACWKSYETPSQPTRIVVLKPSLVKLNDLKAVDSPQSVSPRIIKGEDFFGDVEDNEKDSREVAKAITQQMREKLSRQHRNEALISCVLSNGYVGDESSFNKSEIECASGNLSDSEFSSTVSRHSWDYVNRIGSPYSTSSFSRVPYSSESSVCREAKKRLSERWTMLASNGISQEKRHIRRSSSTLGEMLALSEAKKAALPVEKGFLNVEPKCSYPAVDNESNACENVSNSPRNLMRSKSVPVSSTSYGSNLDMDMRVSDNCQADFQKRETKARGAKSSLRVKMASFFSRNKKPSKDKSLSSEIKDEIHSSGIIPGLIGGRTEGDKGSGRFSSGVPKPSNKTSSSSQVNIFDTILVETGLSMEKPVAFDNVGEKLDQPSPVSVLDPPFDEDEQTETMNPDQQDVDLSLKFMRSNLIDKSPPIGSIARTLSWDDSCVDTSSSYSPNQSFTGKGTVEEEREWFFFVKTLLSVAGMQGEVQRNKLIARWHSPESPLDPLLRDKYIDFNDKGILLEAKRRNKRSTRKLVFDCVNAALVEIAGYGSLSRQRAIPCIEANNSILENTSFTMLDEVWSRTNIWFSCEFKCVSDDCGDSNSLVLESVVRNEVVGKGWIDYLRLEMDNLGKEIEGKLLEELVHEAVVDLTGGM